MAPIIRVRARWTGFNGAPGYTVLHFGGFAAPTPEIAALAATRTRAFFAAIGNRLPNNVRINIEPDVEVIEETNGDLQTAYPAGTQVEVQGAGGTSYAGPVGSVINWKTAGVRNGRRVRGRTFLVPLASASFGTDGTLLAVARTNIQDAANVLAGQDTLADLVVYARPTPADEETGAPKVDNGVAYVVSSSSVPTLAAVLRSRRD